MKIEIADTLVRDAIPKWEKWLPSVASSSTVQSHTSYVRLWAMKTGAWIEYCHEIDEAWISPWVNAQGLKVTTRGIRLAALRSFFKYCTVKQHCISDPTKLVRVTLDGLTHEQKETRKKKCFTEEEFAAVINHLSGRISYLSGLKNPTKLHKIKLVNFKFWKSAALFGRYAGLRMGDIAQLEWACFKTPGKLTVWTDKKDRRVELDMTPHLESAAALIEIVGKTYCFPAFRKLELDKKRRAKLSSQFGRILVGAKVGGHSFHDLRHTRITECVKLGIPMPLVSQMHGHGDERSTLTYVH